MSVTQLNDRIGFKSARFKLPLRNDSSDRLVEILLFDISSLFFSLIRMHQISSSDSECCEINSFHTSANICVKRTFVQSAAVCNVVWKTRFWANGDYALHLYFIFSPFHTYVCFLILCLLIFAYYMTYAFAGISYELNQSMERFHLWPDGGITFGFHIMISIHRTYDLFFHVTQCV